MNVVDNSLSRAKLVSTIAHVRQKYGNEPYTTHLHAVENVLRRFGITDEDILTCAWLHDVLEDTAVTALILRDYFDPQIVDVIELLTEQSSLNRTERHQIAYPRIATNPIATLVKLADRIANCESGGKLEMYSKEYPYFRSIFRNEEETKEQQWQWFVRCGENSSMSWPDNAQTAMINHLDLLLSYIPAHPQSINNREVPLEK